MEKVTGLGGVFIKAKQPHELAQWYDAHLGTQFGKNLYSSFFWRDAENPSQINRTVFSFFKEDDAYFAPSTKPLMLNLRVNDLPAMLQQLKKSGVAVEDKTDDYEYGKFGWLVDSEGTKIELWQPIESGFGEDLAAAAEQMKSAQRITGFGGVFIKCNNNQSLITWYEQHFGLSFTETAHTFKWKQADDETKTGQTIFSFFPSNSTYFQPSQKNFMLNFRVRNLDSLLKLLKAEGVSVAEKTENYDFGKFGWIMDVEGNRLELWEEKEV